MEEAHSEIQGLRAEFKEILEDFYLNWELYARQEWNNEVAEGDGAEETKQDAGQVDQNMGSLEETEKYYDTEENPKGGMDPETGAESAQASNLGADLRSIEVIIV